MPQRVALIKVQSIPNTKISQDDLNRELLRRMFYRNNWPDPLNMPLPQKLPQAKPIPDPAVGIKQLTTDHEDLERWLPKWLASRK